MGKETTLAVVSQSGETLSFFDFHSGERTGRIESMIAEPHELCLDKKRNVVYCTHAYRHGHFWAHGDNGREISITDLNTRKATGVIDIGPYAGPHGIRLHEETDTLYLSVEHGFGDDGPGGVVAVDLKTRQLVGGAPSGHKSHWAVITPDASKAYTCNKTAPCVSVIDLKSWKLIKQIPVAGSEELDISPDGRFVYVPTPSASFDKDPVEPCIKVIDTKTDEIVESVPLELGPSTVHVTTKGTILVGQYRMQSGSTTNMLPKPGKVGAFDPETFELLGEVDVGLYALTIRSTADGSVAFVANILGGTVTVIDLDRFEVLRTLEVDTVRGANKKALQGAHGMAVF